MEVPTVRSSQLRAAACNRSEQWSRRRRHRRTRDARTRLSPIRGGDSVPRGDPRSSKSPLSTRPKVRRPTSCKPWRFCSDVPALALTEANLSALLHPSVGAESDRAKVADAARQARENRRSTPFRRWWVPRAVARTEGLGEISQRQRGSALADVIRIRRAMIRQALTGTQCD